jgi:stearoyl-CoA desaturase (Delta-9 desaturase)
VDGGCEGVRLIQPASTPFDRRTMPAIIPRRDDERLVWRPALYVFIAAHVVPLLAFWTGVSWRVVVLFVVLYVTRAFFVTAGYHRYFAHRAYRTNRAFQFLLAFGGATAAQKGPLWWASHHRDHHRYTDTDRDPHSPQKGFWFSHIGWIFSGAYHRTDASKVEDMARYPELVWLDRHDWFPPAALAVATFALFGWSGLVFGFFGSTVALWHATFSVNSFSHLVGTRRYGTVDTSRNNPVVAVLTLGEGWHNNHHHYPAAARQGFRWWELDISYGALRALSWLRVVRDLRQPPAVALQARRLRAGTLDIGMVRQRLAEAAALARDTAPELADSIAATADRAARAVKGERSGRTALAGAGANER